MANKLFRFTMDISVGDAEALYVKALNHANEGGTPLADGELMLRPDGVIDIGACLIMLFDPGVSPDGTTIIGSESESLDDGDEEENGDD